MSECGFTIQGTNVVDVAQELSVSPCVIFDDIPKDEARIHKQENDPCELHDIDFIIERVDFDGNEVGKSTSESENKEKSTLENCTFHGKQEILAMLTPESCKNEAQEDSKAVSVTTGEGLASKILEENEFVTPKKSTEEDETRTLSSSETSKDITYETQAMTNIFKDDHPSPTSNQDQERFHEAQDLPTPITSNQDQEHFHATQDLPTPTTSNQDQEHFHEPQDLPTPTISTQPKHDHTSSHSIPPQISITDSIDDTFQQLALEELEPVSIASTSTSPPSSDLPKNGNKQSDSTSSSRTSLTSSTSTSQQVALGLLSTALSNRLGSAPLPRIVEWLKINIVQLKMVNKCDGQAKLSIQVKFDNQDVFQTAMVPCTSSCVFGDEFTQEFKPNITSLRLYVTEHLPNQKSRLIGRALIRRKDAVQAASQDNWYTVYGVSSTKSAVSTGIGEICLDTTYDAASKIMKLRILDFTVPPHAADQLRTSNGQPYLGFRVAGYGEFTSMEKLKISSERRSLQTVQLDCSGFAERLKEARARQLSVDSVTSDCTTQSVHSLTLTPGTPCSIRRPTPTSSSGSTSTLFDDSPLRLSIKVYKDPKNESSCCGHVRIPLDDETMLPKGKPTGPNWYEVKSKMTIASTTTTSTIEQKRSLSSSTSMCESRASTSTSLTKTSISSSRNSEKVGEMRLRIWHSIDQILPLVHYQPLYSNLMNSLNMQPQSASLTSLLQCLPIELENLAKPLMRIYFHSNQIRAFFRNICSQYVSSCHDVNTLFRSQSMTSKVLHEFMMFVGHPYLVLSLKPLIDLICVERKCCEIDPAKLKPGDSLEQNMRNLMVYAELAFSQVVGSRSRCPQVLREIFADLRDVVSQFYPRRIEVSRLALSSFLIMRFFAPAILNPKLFDRKRAPPDGDVQRTLILISKILQRLANCVVSTHPLTQKEEWLTPVLTRFSDEHHKSAMIEFLDSVSATGGELSPISKDAGFLKEGIMVERRSGPEKRRSIKNLIHQKRRYVMLTEKELTWQKVKESSGEMATRRAFPLDEITSVNVLTDAKNAFRVSTQTGEVHFQASSPAEMNEWMILIQKQQRRHIMVKNRPSGSDLTELVDIDIELELETIHCILMENRDTLIKWLAALNGDENTPRFPEELLKNLRANEERRLLMETLRKSIEQTLDSIDQIEGAHKAALNLAHQIKNFQPQKGERPLTDNENYLLMRGERKRRKQFN